MVSLTVTEFAKNEFCSFSLGKYYSNDKMGYLNGKILTAELSKLTRTFAKANGNSFAIIIIKKYDSNKKVHHNRI